MTTIRRVYIYVVAFAGLAALTVGLANLGRALLAVLVGASAAAAPGYLRDQVSLWVAVALVGLPLWALHWRWAQRLSDDLEERTSTLRRLYLYLVLAGATLVAAGTLQTWASVVMMALLGAPGGLANMGIPSVPTFVIAAIVWAYHWRVAAEDRAVGGEERGSATLRRWYVYGAAFVGFILVLQGMQQVLQSVWFQVASLPGAQGLSISVPGVADALVGLALWGWHWGWLSKRVGARAQEQDARSTLRSVYLFLGLAAVVVGTLAGVSEALYYVLARALGVAEPGGVAGSLLQAAAGPVSVVVVYGIGWVYQRAAIGRQIQLVAEAPRQVEVRRLYRYLTSLVAVAILATGAGGLLWVVADVATHAAETVLVVTWWQDRASLFATMTAVGLLAWLLHWRPRAPEDAGSLARRVYLYVVLIGGVLGLLGGGAFTVYGLLSMALGSTADGASLTQLGHAMAVALVAAVVVWYHARSVRADTRLAAPRPAEVQPAEARPAEIVVELEAPTPALLEAALSSLRSLGVTVHRMNA